MTKRKNKSNRQKKEKVVVRVERGGVRKRKTNRPRTRARRKLPGISVTPQGHNFLRCAIAPRDFPGIIPTGVPDQYGGPSMVFRHQVATSIDFTTGGTMTLLFLPTPGVAYWSATRAGTVEDLAFTPTKYPDFDTLFGSLSAAPYGATQIDRFRYVSTTVEIVLTSPLLTAGGSINCARLPGIEVVDQVMKADDAKMPSGVKRYIVGTSDTSVSKLSTMPGFYSGHINDGVYGWSCNESGNWDFSPLWVATTELHSLDTNTAGKGLEGDVMGFGNMVPMAITLASVAEKVSVQILVDCVVEYCPIAGSMLARMASPSAPHDPHALECYGEAARAMPAFVPRAKNDGFWAMFMKFISTASTAVAPLFGPVGQAVSLGLGTITNGLASLFT